MMVKFSRKIGAEHRMQIAQMADWLDAYIQSSSLAPEFAPGPARRRREGRPTVRYGEVVGDVEVLHVEPIGQGCLKARCAINLHLEVDVNDEYANTDGTEGWMDVTLEVDPRGRRVAGHHTHDLCEDCFFCAP